MAEVNDKLMVVHSKLNTLLDDKMAAMPKGFNKTRFMQNCMTVLQDTKDIDKVNPTMIARTMLKGAFLGLDFFNKECYAICYGSTLNFQTDYKGEVKLCKKYSINPIKDIYAKLVKEGDEFFEEIRDGDQVINFKPKPFSDNKIIGAFAVVLFKDGTMAYETMTVAEMEEVRKHYSKQANGQAWTKSTGEMYKKTVLRRLCKNIELDFETIEQKKIFDESADIDLEKAVEPKKTILETITDVEFTESESEENKEEEMAV